MTEKSLITFFVGGLRDDLRSDLKIAKPISLKQAFSLAKMYEANRIGKGSSALTVPAHRSNYRPNLVNTSTPLLKTPHTLTAPSNKLNPGYRKPPSYEERKMRATKGLCYYCEEKFVPGHRCMVDIFVSMRKPTV